MTAYSRGHLHNGDKYEVSVKALAFLLLLLTGSASAQLQRYKTVDPPQPGEYIDQPCRYEASFPAGNKPVEAAWVTYDRGADISEFYSNADVLSFAVKNDLAMVLARQCPATRTSEKGEMDMYPEHGLGRSLFTALGSLGAESGHPELANAKLIILGFSGTGAYFGHFVAYAPTRVLAAILTNPGQTDPDNIDKIKLDAAGVAVPELIIAGGRDSVGGVVKPYAFYDHHRSEGAPWVYLVQNNIPHCCINNTRPFMLKWLQSVIDQRRPDAQRPLLPMNLKSGWYGSIQPCSTPYKDHWGLPLWNVCEAHIERAGKALPSGELPSGYFSTESLARAWLKYIKLPNHPKTSFARPDDPDFGDPTNTKPYR
jgi:dienelactone hydrolase